MGIAFVILVFIIVMILTLNYHLKPKERYVESEKERQENLINQIRAPLIIELCDYHGYLDKERIYELITELDELEEIERPNDDEKERIKKCKDSIIHELTRDEHVIEFYYEALRDGQIGILMRNINTRKSVVLNDIKKMYPTHISGNDVNPDALKGADKRLYSEFKKNRDELDRRAARLIKEIKKQMERQGQRSQASA